ncbi:MAG: helix-turn-helix domain-containing protein [Anaerolineales bacterium]|nr:helix-turn-helix domain-containing protein [Anaerolineales bacterium]
MTESIGQQLKKAREARNLTIAQVTQVTRIRAHHLDAIEADNFDALPSPVQARGFLRLYAEYLGLSLEELIANQRAESAEPAALQPVTASSAIETEAIEAEPEPAVDEMAEMEAEAEITESEIPESMPGTPPPAPFSQTIFIAIGEQLRQHRDALGLTLDEVERHTHVRKHYLQALEAGDFEHLPTSVQARGMLNNYAHFLDMQVDAILLRFAEGLQAQRLERQPQRLEKPQRARLKANVTASFQRFLSIDLIFGGGLILLLLIFAVWGTSRVINLRAAPKPEATAPSISDVLLASPIAGAETAVAVQTSQLITPLPASGQTTVIALPTTIPGHVQVVVVALERVWVRVTVDGKVKLEGRLIAGSAYPFDGDEQIEVLTGDGSAVQIIYNQADLGVMGTFGEVVNRIYTPKNILNPTPTPKPTSTATPRFTPIPSKTPTRIYSPTPTIKPGIP